MTDIMQRYHRWLEQKLADSDLTEELNMIGRQEEEITERFYCDLKFGTGGLRGIIGAGTNRMNIYTVARATQGYAKYLKEHWESPSVAIAYDSRIKSEAFARTAAGVLAANGIQVKLFGELMPTPALSFAVRYLKCSGGIVITASHNPAEYNGYKVYGADGGQITSKAAKEILKQIQSVEYFQDEIQMDWNAAMEMGRIEIIGSEVTEHYLKAVAGELLESEILDRNISIVYTPLNGAGRACVTKILKDRGFQNLHVVAEQEWPDGNFPTCPYPNPEKKEALELAVRDARKWDCELVLATDPDCDRVGVVVKNEMDYQYLTGNETGLLLFEYICKRRNEKNKMPACPVLMKTIVTIDMVKKIADDYGVKVVDLLTGFKYIGEQIGELEKNGEECRYIFGFEESYGYLSGGYVRDKDGVNAALMVCEMAAYYKSLGKSLAKVLDELYQKYGFCLNTQHSYQFQGASGEKNMEQIMVRFREDGPGSLAGLRVVAVSDYQQSVARNLETGDRSVIELPKSNVMKYECEDGSSLVVRPSGTEPKLKLYFSVNSSDSSRAAELEKIMVNELEERYSLKSE